MKACHHPQSPIQWFIKLRYLYIPLPLPSEVKVSVSLALCFLSQEWSYLVSGEKINKPDSKRVSHGETPHLKVGLNTFYSTAPCLISKRHLPPIYIKRMETPWLENNYSHHPLHANTFTQSSIPSSRNQISNAVLTPCPNRILTILPQPSSPPPQGILPRKSRSRDLKPTVATASAAFGNAAIAVPRITGLSRNALRASRWGVGVVSTSISLIIILLL